MSFKSFSDYLLLEKNKHEFDKYLNLDRNKMDEFRFDNRTSRHEAYKKPERALH